ncbi:RNA polymerase, sigma subunit, SigZ [Maribacter sedimenticola]|uniref:RNA polymerase, sigma subunit, SigZ n=1 Tax=Maribacter sedimenticola TaxID=228956 RepID=A0ABY1SI97_9FLAO|nr:sigma-70 family RNA polymerase sigma factor [Maribacter sedimenticola]SNR54794.1 RNA polymerase, sigma subunit, SigZ [Maribacter sedimenticola]
MEKEITIIWKDLSEELFMFILNKVKDEQSAKDIHQEVFIKVMTNIHQLKQISRLTSWIYQITRNSIIDHFRGIQKKQDISVAEIELPVLESNNFDYSRLSHCINQKINALSQQHKEAIVLTTFQNYSQKELAAHLKISYSGTKSRVQTAKKILKETILDCPNVTSDKTGKILDYKKNDF